ncbi:stilbene synthase [Planomonospora parontospora subsp. antibiotica]|uniref:type III polyketide synthase n=1 Tax=Planomonospora parontospora TaxID=58119 RepID=UPI0016716EEE|nr:3-oxoacyl-[acyl-carrier-protein] synthase III C-terminal domain-containing protein [Planomonospora parontospora]GGL16632.1 stilbene synthase [Planomonospora parontospora subsp. antibiotica]GII15340.1 stilbene synthase [Planomonospora parontospora subsp. antibiotica]
MSRITAVHGVLPPNRHSQDEITDAFARLCLPEGADRLLLNRFHASAGVGHRHLSLPLDRYDKLDGFGAANDVFIDTALELGAQAVGGALEEAGLAPEDVDMIMCTSVTGVAAPSIEARLAGRLGLRPDVKRVPVFGLGCVAGAAGIARVHDYLRGWPDHVAVLLSVELCSLTLQRGDASVANLVASALFGDGAAAVVLCGDGHEPPGRGPGRGSAEGPGRGPAERPEQGSARGPGRVSAGGPVRGPEVVATRSRLYPGSERVMGWEVGDTGFRVVLDASVPDVVRTYLADDVHGFLADHGLTAGDVTAWVCHPGGPKVLEAVSEALRLPPGALDVTWRSLADVGNLSSSSVLHVLRDTIALRPPPGTPGLIIAMGPGFCSELVLLRW